MIVVFLLQERHDQLQHGEDEPDNHIPVNATTVSLADNINNATVCLSATQTSAHNTSTEHEENVLSDEVFDAPPSQRLLNLTDSVRRLAGGFQSTTNLQNDDEWVSTSSESGTPVFHHSICYFIFGRLLILILVFFLCFFRALATTTLLMKTI